MDNRKTIDDPAALVVRLAVNVVNVDRETKPELTTTASSGGEKRQRWE